MDNQIYIVNLPVMGSSWVSVNYLQNHPVYNIKSLENNEADVIVFISHEGRCQRDGAGITRMSEAIGEAIDLYELG